MKMSKLRLFALVLSLMLVQCKCSDNPVEGTEGTLYSYPLTNGNTWQYAYITSSYFSWKTGLEKQVSDTVVLTLAIANPTNEVWAPVSYVIQNTPVETGTIWMQNSDQGVYSKGFNQITPLLPYKQRDRVIDTVPQLLLPTVNSPQSWIKGTKKSYNGIDTTILLDGISYSCSQVHTSGLVDSTIIQSTLYYNEDGILLYQYAPDTIVQLTDTIISASRLQFQSGTITYSEEN